MNSFNAKSSKICLKIIKSLTSTPKTYLKKLYIVDT